LYYPSVDAGFDYDRGQEKEVIDKLKQRNGEAAGIDLQRYAPLRLSQAGAV
jgi:hypothetical protein